jgi:hypothetical protein
MTVTGEKTFKRVSETKTKNAHFVDTTNFLTCRKLFSHCYCHRSHLDEKSKQWIQKHMQTRDILPPPEESPFNQSMTYPVSMDDAFFQVACFCTESMCVSK